jgi:hypothetical protein
MRNIIISVVSGAVGAGLVSFLVSVSYATPSSENIQRAIRTGQCRIETGSTYLNGGTQCYENTVMTGTFNNSMYCSELTIVCE